MRSERAAKEACCCPAYLPACSSACSSFGLVRHLQASVQLAPPLEHITHGPGSTILARPSYLLLLQLPLPYSGPRRLHLQGLSGAKWKSFSFRYCCECENRTKGRSPSHHGPAHCC